MPAARSACSASAGEPAQPASAARSVLRRWANAASTTANTSARVAVVSGGSRRTMRTSPESTLGTGQNTVRGTAPARAAAQYQATFTLGTPYTLRAGRGRQPFGHLGLHEHQTALQRRHRLQQLQHDRHGDVVGQIGHESGRRARDLDPQRVAGDHGQGGLAEPLGDGTRQCRSENGVDLDGRHRVPGVEQAQCQRTESRPDLEDVLAGQQIRGAHDAPDRVRVVQEVLPEGLGGAHPEVLGERADLGRAEQAAQKTVRINRSFSLVYGGYSRFGSGRVGLRSTALRWLNVSKPHRPW